MARQGIARVKTGCKTCNPFVDDLRIRRIKCDEKRPSCSRCISTGRKCDGYISPPSETYSWAQLLRSHPRQNMTSISHLNRDGAAAANRAMHFYHRIAAPALTGSLNKTFWTTIVVQISNQEPVAGHAVLALSSIYETFSKGVHEATTFAVWHYNKAIRLLRTTKDRALVLFVCLLFICIEILRKNPQDVIAHCRHGINILNEIHAESDFLRNHVVPTMRQLSLIPYFYGVDPKTFPTIDRPVPSATQQLTSIAEAHARHTLKDRHSYDEEDRALLCLLEVRHIISKIQLLVSLSKSECDYDAYLDDFRTVVDLTAKATAVPVDSGSPSTRTVFTDDSAIEVGFSPLLFVVVSKCRSLSVRIAALKLMEQLARPRNNMWTKHITSAVVRRIIEIEHLISISEVETDDLFDDGELPPDERRVVSADFWCTGNRKRGSWRLVRFFLRDSDSGNFIVRDEWLKVEKPSGALP
ncbi:c6 zinc finger domain protein [Colletotrichum incanum]|uniref:C6 zinc finger domain protein n=1 Tax=Colletotrichum incanum TaxID=1573173 RepID=A0A161X008_COLIC|nr:c6 zinc finger domain protein [Colletotrichum incanum]